MCDRPAPNAAVLDFAVADTQVSVTSLVEVSSMLFEASRAECRFVCTWKKMSE